MTSQPQHTEDAPDRQAAELRLSARARRYYDDGDYDRACDEADRLAARLEREHRTDSLAYSEAMCIFGLASYRNGDLVMADNALSFACDARDQAGFGQDEIAEELLLMLSAISLLRNNLSRAVAILEQLREEEQNLKMKH